MSQRIEEDLLERYLAGECTAEERARVERWGAADARNADLLTSLREAATPEIPPAFAVDAAWAKLAARIDSGAGREVLPAADLRIDDASRKPESVRAARSLALPRGWLRLAAALIVAVGGIAVWRVVDRSTADGPAVAAEFDEYAAPVGTIRQLTLPDSSEVTLAPASRLRVPRDMSDARDVVLDGEAFFRVAHDEARPFRVLSNGNAARVLGTEFDVRTGRGADALTVAVVSGRVGVGPEDEDPSAVLEPGQMAVLDSLGSARVGPADLDRILGWRGGRIELDDVTLADALVELERWYDVELEVTDSVLAARRVTASFRTEPLDQVLESLTIALGASYQRDGRVYRVLPSPTTPPR